MTAWIDAREALERLGSKPQTLYANVSRGRIGARPDPSDSRRSLYRASDVDRLAARKRGRRSAEAVASDAVSWGDPVLPSAISTIAGGRLFYRGADAVTISRTETLENVAGLLWETDPLALSPAGDEGAGNFAAALGAMADRAGCDPPSYGRSPAALRVEAGAVLQTMADALAGPGEGPLHERLARRWRRATAADHLRRALVLMADHELNASTFAVRVVISTGASLAAGVLAGLAALGGPLHGDASAGIFALADRADVVGADAATREWLEQGRPLPAFGHHLYPAGDPRGAELLAATGMPSRYSALAAVAEPLVGEPPNADFALAALAEMHDLPREAPLVIFALSRTTGWLAHALEQAAAGRLIRPRARYVGPPVIAGD